MFPLTSPIENHEAPTVTVQSLLPKEGPIDAETEVWIKGTHFSSQGIVE